MLYAYTSIYILVSNSCRAYQIISNAQSNLHTYCGTYGRSPNPNLRVNKNHKINYKNERTSKTNYTYKQKILILEIHDIELVQIIPYIIMPQTKKKSSTF